MKGGERAIDETTMRLECALNEADANLGRNYMTERKVLKELCGREWKSMARLSMGVRHYDVVAATVEAIKRLVSLKEWECCSEALSRGGKGGVNTPGWLTGHRDHTEEDHEYNGSTIKVR